MPFPPKPACIPLFILALCSFAFYTTFFRHHHPSTASNQSSRNTLFYQNKYLSYSTNYTIATYLRHLTRQPHLAGTPSSHRTALYVYNNFRNLHLSTHLTNYTALLSYPTHSSLTAHFTNGSSVSLPLSEPGISRDDVVPPYHAYSPSGSAYSEAVFLNYGREQDYRALRAVGAQVGGCVGIVRRGGGMTRNEVVETAAEHGVAAVLMYTEGSDDGTFRKGVERGTVMKGVGDPLTPGWAAVDGSERLELDDNRVTRMFPGVPSIPVSSEVAETILRSLEGVRVPHEWRETLGNCNRIRRAGPGPVMLNFTYQVNGNNVCCKLQ